MPLITATWPTEVTVMFESGIAARITSFTDDRFDPTRAFVAYTTDPSAAVAMTVASPFFLPNRFNWRGLVTYTSATSGADTQTSETLRERLTTWPSPIDSRV